MEESNGFDCGPTDLLCDEETKSLCFLEDDGGDLVETSDDRSHLTDGDKSSGGSESGPLILWPCLSEDCIRWMVERESAHMPRDDYLMRLRTGELDMGLRRTALDWMIKACAHHNFGELCLYLATNYLDRFLSVYKLPGGKTWVVQLAAVACLSLAAKFDEVNVPHSVDLQAGEPKFLFEAKTIQRMELLVLNHLKWNIKPYTPFNFIEYFHRKMSGSDVEIPSEPLITRSIQIILNTIKGIDFLEFKPSEIAAAVASYVLGEQAMDFDKALSGFLIIEKGRVLKCLELIQDLIPTSGTAYPSDSRTTKAINLANGSILSLSICDSPNGVLDAACLSYKTDERKRVPSEAIPNKKRRKLDEKTDFGG
ncbi:Cyclin-D4-1 [Striga hermonthica]|uniref:Cyclin-D4-1 n=1 Tax=Striga hermonthica TaxID=68872 RepID=A0A9N7R952_STRHE|nr:Cyclin-D4-1 [Striga hermonthica]